LAALIAACGALGTGATASEAVADAPPLPTVPMAPWDNPDGSGSLDAAEATNPGTGTWQTCAPDGSSCAPATATPQALSASAGKAIGITTAGASPGVVFVATANDGTAERSPVWLGNLSPTSPPSATGSIQANSLVTPPAGTWSGGFAGDIDALELDVCANANGTGCISLTNDHYGWACADSAAVIDPYFTGWYLRVDDQREVRPEAILS
jgi:hypothetical protein